MDLYVLFFNLFNLSCYQLEVNDTTDPYIHMISSPSPFIVQTASYRLSQLPDTVPVHPPPPSVLLFRGAILSKHPTVVSAAFGEVKPRCFLFLKMQ